MKLTDCHFIILADNTTSSEGTQGGQPNLLAQFLPFILIFVLFYFILIRPQKQKQKKLEEQRNALRSGDKVITAGGIHGLVTNVKAHSVTLKVADNVKIEFEKASIGTVISKENTEPVASATEEKEEAAP